MSKKTNAPKNATAKKTLHWSLGLFRSASNGGDPIVLYCRKDGSVAPYYAKKVKAKQALFHASYSGVTYADARKQLLKDAAKASSKTKTFLADAAKADASPAKDPVAAK